MRIFEISALVLVFVLKKALPSRDVYCLKLRYRRRFAVFFFTYCSILIYSSRPLFN